MDKEGVIAQATQCEIVLETKDIVYTEGVYTIDGMNWREWLEEMGELYEDR